MALRAIFPGSFDPPTIGHFDLIQRAAALCDELDVVVAVNIDRSSALFTPEERVQLLQKLPLSSNVFVHVWAGLLVDYAKETKANLIFRGMRRASEWDAEWPRAWMQRQMGDLETLFIPVNPLYSAISSSLVREVGRFAKDLQGLVPDAIATQVYDRIHERAT